jgi:hypothetical protein
MWLRIKENGMLASARDDRHPPLRPVPRWYAGVLLALVLGGCAVPGAAQERPAPAPAAGESPLPAAPAVPAGPSYAALVELARAAEIAVVVAIADQARVPPERAPGLEPGKARLYFEADTETLLAGRSAVGAQLRFLADRDLDARGRAPNLEEQRYLLFARPVAGRPGEIQLISPAAMLPADPGLVERARTVLRQIAEGPALPEITGIREAISVAGNLAGESETQLFLESAGGEPVSLTVIRRPGMAPEWGVSWTDIVDVAARPAEPETLAWYRLACFLPAELPEGAFLQSEAEARSRAREDYAFILAELGPCTR